MRGTACSLLMTAFDLEGPTATAMVGGVWTELFYDDTTRERLYNTQRVVAPQADGCCNPTEWSGYTALLHLRNG